MDLDPNNAIARVDAGRMLMALPFRPYGDPRYYLNAVALAPGGDDGALIMATDAYAAACIRDVGGRVDRPMLLPIGKEQKSALKKGAYVLVSPEGITWISSESGSPLWVSAVPLVEGRFIDLRMQLGNPADYLPGLVGSYNPALLDRIRQAYANRTHGVHFYHHPHRTGVALFTLGHDGFGLVMGIREPGIGPDLLASIPAYFQQQEAA